MSRYVNVRSVALLIKLISSTYHDSQKGIVILHVIGRVQFGQISIYFKSQEKNLTFTRNDVTSVPYLMSLICCEAVHPGK